MVGYSWQREQGKAINGFYRKKPIVIEAFRWEGDSVRVPKWFEDKMSASDIYFHSGAVLIKTLEGEMRADKGDWIIKGVKNELYPCKNEIFQATYDHAG